MTQGNVRSTGPWFCDMKTASVAVVHRGCGDFFLYKSVYVGVKYPKYLLVSPTVVVLIVDVFHIGRQSGWLRADITFIMGLDKIRTTVAMWSRTESVCSIAYPGGDAAATAQGGGEALQHNLHLLLFLYPRFVHTSRPRRCNEVRLTTA